MRETKFIEQNQEKWQEFEGYLEGRYKRADKLNELFVQITDDLSYSRTFYPNRSVRVYLNGLAQRIFFNIYKHRKSRWGRVLQFWTDELPRLLYEARRDLLVSFLVFALTFGIGVLSCVFDPGFAEVILGESYINMTLSNIESGDPMAVYKQMAPMGMSMGITVNNLFVAFLTFVLGVFFSIGSLVMIARTGFMVGAFQYFFIERGLFWDSFLTIWTHGTLEISAIIIAGAAGATMGRGLVFPGTFTRTQAFQQSARRGVKIMVGTIPLFIVAGFIEGFLTRFTETPALVRGLFILICLLFVLIYFVWYPQVVARVKAGRPLPGSDLPPDNSVGIDFRSVKSSGAIFADTFLIFKAAFGRILLVLAGVSAAYCAWAFTGSARQPQDMVYYRANAFAIIEAIDPLLTGHLNASIWIYNGLAFALMAWLLFRQLGHLQGADAQPKTGGLLSCLLGGLSISAMLHFTGGWAIVLVIFSLGVLLLWMYTSYQERLNPAAGIARGMALMGQAYWQSIGLLLLTAGTGLIFACLADSALARFFFDLIGWIVNFEQETMNNISVVLLTFFYIFILYGVMGMLMASFALFYHSRLEVQEARRLREQLQSFGEIRQIRGLDKE